MKRLKGTSRSLSRSLLHHQQIRHLEYGSNNIKQLYFDLSAHQFEDHGEDSYFMHQNAAFGVADGVGGWAHVANGNPKEYSKQIMDGCVTILDSLLASSDNNSASINAKELLVGSAIPVMQSSLIGGTTALVGMIVNQNVLSIANVGDSRFYVFRKFVGERVPVLYFISPEQRYSFNAPLQLCNIENVGKNALAVDPAKWAEYYELPMCSEDIMVFVTDGISDNLFPQELNEVIANGFKSGFNSQDYSKAIVELAVQKANGLTRNKDTPFGHPKQDDCTCVVGLVKSM